MNVYFKDGSFLDFRRREGHYYMYARAVHQRSGIDGEKIDFIFDTGAQNTILSKRRADEFGYLKMETKKSIKAGGIGGGFMLCSSVAIPSIVLTEGIIINDPVALIPEDHRFNINILGQDILEKFSYYVDAKKQYIYFDIP